MAARRERWARIVERAEASGMPIRQFCEKHDVDEGQFYHWRHRLELDAAKSKSKPAPEPGFVLVQAVPAASAPEDKTEAQAEAGSGVLELVLDRGWRLRIPRGADEAALRAVLGVLQRP